MSAVFDMAVRVFKKCLSFQSHFKGSCSRYEACSDIAFSTRPFTQF